MAARKTREILEGGTGLPPNPTIDIQNDEFRGMGGSYIIDPATGKRVRMEGPGVAVHSATHETETAEEEMTNESE